MPDVGAHFRARPFAGPARAINGPKSLYQIGKMKFIGSRLSLVSKRDRAADRANFGVGRDRRDKQWPRVYSAVANCSISRQHDGKVRRSYAWSFCAFNCSLVSLYLCPNCATLFWLFREELHDSLLVFHREERRTLIWTCTDHPLNTAFFIIENQFTIVVVVSFKLMFRWKFFFAYEIRTLGSKMLFVSDNYANVLKLDQFFQLLVIEWYNTRFYAYQ